MIIPKKTEVLSPPPTFQEQYVGTPKRRPKRRRLEKVSFPGPSAGRGAFLIAGYYRSQSVSQSASHGSMDLCAIDRKEWQISAMPCKHTEVVLTPHSSTFSNVGVGAAGVSMNSNSDSEPLALWVLEDMIAVFSQLTFPELVLQL